MIETLDSGLIPWDYGGRKTGPALCGRNYSIPSKKRCRNMPTTCVWTPVKDLPYSTTAKQYSTWRDNRVSKRGKNLPFVLSRKFSLGSWVNREGRNQFPLFCFDAGLHKCLEGMVSARWKSLSIPACCRRASAYPELNLAAGRPQCLASSAGITNQRATETGPKRHASPVLIECLR